MSEFKRWLPPEAIELLRSKPQWWRDLLACRFKVGNSNQPLLLAIRNGYINAYAEGQSVLKVGFKTTDKLARLVGEIHHKYVLPDVEGQIYLEFDGSSVNGQQYEGMKTLDEWVRKARTYVKKEKDEQSLSEKEGVAVIAANNSNVIDVEMGQNTTGDRIDIVALEQDGDAIKIVFYEAKLFRNGALRADNLRPKVLGQLERYRKWINADGRREEIKTAYRTTCQLLLAVNSTRDADKVAEIDPLIRLAAEAGSSLEVDAHPRLLIFGYKPDELNTYWKRHESALREHGVRLFMAPDPIDIVLPRSSLEITG